MGHAAGGRGGMGSVTPTELEDLFSVCSRPYFLLNYNNLLHNEPNVATGRTGSLGWCGAVGVKQNAPSSPDGWRTEL